MGYQQSNTGKSGTQQQPEQQWRDADQRKGGQPGSRQSGDVSDESMTGKKKNVKNKEQGGSCGCGGVEDMDPRSTNKASSDVDAEDSVDLEDTNPIDSDDEDVEESSGPRRTVN